MFTATGLRFGASFRGYADHHRKDRVTFPDDYNPLNFCRTCGKDFTSLRAFDAHRSGTPDERFCLDPAEAGLELRSTVDGVDRWGLIATEDESARLHALKVLIPRAGVAQEAIA